MPHLAPFAQDQTKLADKCDDGLIRVGRAADRSGSYALCLWIAMGIVLCVDIVLRAQVPTVWLIFGGIPLASFLHRLFPIRLVILLDSGTKMFIPLNRAQLRKIRAANPEPKSLEFRPRYVADGKTLVELRSDWRGNMKWEVYVPDSVVPESVEEYLRTHLPNLESAITMPS